MRNVFFLIAALFPALFEYSAWAYVDEVLPALETFSPYKPSYFIMGRPDTKVQVSFKVQPLETFPIYFGYTQIMSWDLTHPSAPMRDITFNPEFFYRQKLGDQNARRWIDFSPYEHESNGKEGPSSRSWNRAWVRYSETVTEGEISEARSLSELRTWEWDFKVAVPYWVEESDLPHFRGIWELSVTFSNFLGPYWRRGDLIVRLYPGGDSRINPLLGGQEVTWRMKFREVHLVPLLVFQIFHGYGETLLEYNQERVGFRAGIGF